MIDIVLVYSLAVFFVYYVINYADLLEFFRSRAIPKFPRWIGYSLSCAFCFTFWTTGILSFFFTGFIPLVLVSPPTVLLINLSFLKLKK